MIRSIILLLGLLRAAVALDIYPVQSLISDKPVINLDGLGPGRSFYDSETLTVQLVADGPIWTLINQHSNANLFVGSSEDYTVQAYLYRSFDAATGLTLTVGNIRDSSTQLLYQIQPDATATETTVKVTRFQDIPRGNPEGKSRPGSNGTTPTNGQSIQDEIYTATAGTVIDVMVIYTTAAECKVAGLTPTCSLTATTQAGMVAAIEIAVEFTNMAYMNSGIDLELNLVHTFRDDSGYDETGKSIDDCLDDISGRADSSLTYVPTLRQDKGADMVAIIVDTNILKAEGFAGVAWLGGEFTNGVLGDEDKDSMFSVSDAEFLSEGTTFAHELGHNQGCNHDRGQENQCDVTAHPNTNYGYRCPTNACLTIMSYSTPGGQCDGLPADTTENFIPYFSGTSVYNSPTLGPITLGAPNNNCAAQIISSKDTIAAFFSSTTPEPTPMPTPSPTPMPTPMPTVARVDSGADGIPDDTKDTPNKDPPTPAPTECPPVFPIFGIKQALGIVAGAIQGFVGAGMGV